MRVQGIIWKKDVVEKLERKHQVQTWEVEEVLNNQPTIYFVEKGNISGENLYLALGQGDDGRYLAVYFVYKSTKDALIITARDMNTKERRRYGKRK